MDTLIEASHLSLRFSAPTDKKGSIKKWVLDAVRGRVRSRHFLALDDISFRIERGEAVGLVGRNGAGKSTLLKLVTGIVNPTAGSIAVRGQVAPLLALGNGLDPRLTGRENIYLNGAILGYEKAYLRAHEADIVDFSELGDFIDAPVRTYSSGMTMRLAFSIATAASPEILILDEVLAVGDAPFQAKCRARIAEIIADGATIFFVSHSLSDIVQLCSRAIWLNKGRVVMDGPAGEVADAYRRDVVPGECLGAASEPVPVFRFRAPGFGGELLTADEEERDAVMERYSREWTPAGIAYRAHRRRTEGTLPLHRFFDRSTRAHFYSLDLRELNALRRPGTDWQYEGPAQYVFPAPADGLVPVLRFWNGNLCQYLFTADPAEADALRRSDSGWTLEKIAFWALPADRPPG